MRKFFTLLILFCSAAVYAQNTKSGSITGTTCFGIDTTNAGTVGISVQNTSSGPAWTGVIQPQAAIGGDPASNISVTAAGGGSASTITANGVYYAAVSGSTYVQVCGNTVTNTAAVKLFPAQYSKNVGGSVGAAVVVGGLSTTPGFDNSVPIQSAINAAATTGGQVSLPPGVYSVCNPINMASFVTLSGTGPPGSTALVACSTMSPQLNLIQAGYNSTSCVQAFGSVTVTGTLPGVLTLPVMTSLGGGGAVTATSTLSGGNVIATFTGTFGGTAGILPIAQQTITGTGFTGVTNYNSDWTVISATTTTIIAYQAGGSSFGAGSTGTLSLTFRFPAAGTWNNQYVFVAGTEYQVTSSTSSSLTLATYNGATGSQTFQGVYSGCPVGWSVSNMTIDANCGTSTAAGVPCTGTPVRGTGAGNALSCRGCYRGIVRDVVLLHAPNDCVYTEGGLFVNNVIPVYPGLPSGTFGLTATVFGENIRYSECNNNGAEHNGPSDGMWVNMVGAFTGVDGYKAACIPGSFGVCGNDTFMFGPHMIKTGSWSYQFLVEQYVNMAEADGGGSASSGSFGVDQQLDVTGPGGVISSGVLIANGLASDLVTGDCLYIASPNAAFSSGFAIADTITNVNCSGVITGWGLRVPIHALDGTNVGRVHVSTGMFSSNTSGTWSGGGCLGGNSASFNDLRFFTQGSATGAVGIDLSCGGTVTSLNRFIGRNLNANNFTNQLKWPAVAVNSQIDAFVAANANQNQYCTAGNSCATAAPTGLDVTVHAVCNGCLDATDPSISTVNAGFSVPFAIGSFPACTAANGGQRLTANNCNAACTVGGTCTAGGTTICEMYCKGSAATFLETGLTE